ncbi:uncharacterized protein LOC144361512 [Saccoglossus kowalevskii]
MTCSPFILNAVLKTHLEANNTTPTSADLKDNIYVDNVVSGTENVTEAEKYYHDANALMRSSGFNLRSWSSNCKEIRTLAEKDNALEMNTNVGILGIAGKLVHLLSGNSLDIIRTTESLNAMLLKSSQSTDVHELHVFVDASPIAYGAAVYLRQDRHTSLVISKTRVAPLKEMTLPRLELMAALIGSRLILFVFHALKDKINITKHVLWSDSQIVIHWIRSEKTLPIFVANRIKEINEFPCDVKYCPTNENPADLITRGISAESLMKSDIWWHGPTWLKLGDWPVFKLFDSTAYHVAAAIPDPEIGHDKL